MKWTDEQLQVINLRKRNLLVSAAAGSGKTAVLIERILGLIMDPVHPVDVDRLLIVTFTNAAAEEMRSRLRDALSKRLSEDPNNRRLRVQLQLVPKAQVSTIDSFCLYILRNYPEETELDPSFRIMDQGEEKLLQSDVMEMLLEEQYDLGTEEFLEFVESYSSGKNDEAVSELVLQLFRFMRSCPWPEQWLDDCLERLRVNTLEALVESDWFSWYLEETKLRLQSLIDQYRLLLDRCNVPTVPETFAHAYQNDIGRLQEALDFRTYEEAKRKICGIALERQPVTKKKDGYDPTLQEKIKNRRAVLKKRLENVQGSFTKSAEEILSELSKSAKTAEELVRLVRRFNELYDAEKRKKGIADFADIEHMALSVLYENGTRTAAAKELSRRFSEIMIDEYQDSNRVQETLLLAVSRIPDGENNMFMVGDMKQSIYRFRMADPGLFTEKYEHFTREESASQLLELSMNFRSRREVTRSVNWFFFQLMQRAVGGIGYDRHSALYHGAEYPAAGEKNAYRTELLIADTAEVPEEYSRQEAEALLVAKKIRELIDSGFQVTGKDAEGNAVLRPVLYRDMVILLRSAASWDSVFQQVLEAQGIPVYVESRSGYFDAPEVHLVMSLLSVIDNPINDIPLAAVLHSPLFGFTAEELARIRADVDPQVIGNGLYGALLQYRGEAAISSKIDAFLRRIAGFRKLSASLPLPMLLRAIYEDTGILSYVRALPGGERRAANLQALLTKAGNYENTSYHGIFHFIRYVEKLRKYQADEGEQNTVSENDDVVRIMTIHKSKGLEFPVVFLSGLAKQFNQEDSKKKIVLHRDYGIGADLADPKARLRKKTFIRSVFVEKNRLESLGEELRVLYVGMTRAREKLFLTAAAEDTEKLLTKYEPELESLPQRLMIGELTEAKSYLSWLLCAIRGGMPGANGQEGAGPAVLRICPAEYFVPQAAEAEKKALLTYEALLQTVSDTVPAPEADRAFDERFGFCYDDVLSRIPATVSVSALKARAYEEEVYEPAALVQDIPDQEGSAKGAEKASGIRGAERGTLYHRVMEELDPSLDVKEQLDRWLLDGRLQAEEYQVLEPGKLEAFFSSPLGMRFVRAYQQNRGFRERQFIIGIPVSEAYPELSGRPEGAEMMMLQGIIDLYFEEDDGLVIVDYKTDRVKEPETLLSRYRIQLQLYAEALERAIGKPVKEKWIWSFALGKEIPV